VLAADSHVLIDAMQRNTSILFMISERSKHPLSASPFRLLDTGSRQKQTGRLSFAASQSEREKRWWVAQVWVCFAWVGMVALLMFWILHVWHDFVEPKTMLGLMIMVLTVCLRRSPRQLGSNPKFGRALRVQPTRVARRPSGSTQPWLKKQAQKQAM